MVRLVVLVAAVASAVGPQWRTPTALAEVVVVADRLLPLGHVAARVARVMAGIPALGFILGALHPVAKARCGTAVYLEALALVGLVAVPRPMAEVAAAALGRWWTTLATSAVVAEVVVLLRTRTKPILHPLEVTDARARLRSCCSSAPRFMGAVLGGERLGCVLRTVSAGWAYPTPSQAQRGDRG